MDICGDMAMELDLAHVRKRHCMDDIGEFPNSKRTCRGLENLTNGDGILLNQLNECDMVYLQMQMAANKDSFQTLTPQRHQNMVVPGSMGSGQPCPRCIAGESGHINHILGL
ncbi:uncharacterized protein C10orf143 homolog [Xenopus tropicalis]|uniref:Uncharacterized protein C10orf143 homolog n=1 Tax=Xenopus tropicalis TaxID=8364 RepID=A0A8J0QM48_XENTR|eukprot:XP_002932693.1 PREDICTED: uncharacterized protein LOC100495010 [Xenopus tropicalis]